MEQERRETKKKRYSKTIIQQNTLAQARNCDIFMPMRRKQQQ